MRLDAKGDPAHVEACRHALMIYAADIQAHLPQLAEDIRARYSEMRRPGWPKALKAKPPLKPVGLRELPGKAVVDSGFDEPKPEV